MKNFIQSWKVKVVIGSVLFISVFSLGAYARPGIDLTAELVSGVFGTKKIAYVSPKSDFEKGVEERMNRQSNKDLCRDIAEMELSNELALKYTKRFDELAPMLNSKVNMLNAGVSEETIKNTIKTEISQGRR